MNDNLNMILKFGPSIKTEIITIILENNAIHCKLGKDEKEIRDIETINKVKNIIIYNLPEIREYTSPSLYRGFKKLPKTKGIIRELTIMLEDETISINGALKDEKLNELWLNLVRCIREIVKF